MTIRLDREGSLFRGRSQKTNHRSGTKACHYVGSEGPIEDPYHYDEWVIERNGMCVIGHFGLAVWVRVDGIRVENDEEDLQDIFERLVGVPMRVLEVAHRRYRSTCVKCGCRRTRSASGYPGEHFNICVQCGTIVSTDFNESEII